MVFHNFVERHRAAIFSEGADSLFNKLDQAAESVGTLLQLALNELAEKVSITITSPETVY